MNNADIKISFTGSVNEGNVRTFIMSVGFSLTPAQKELQPLSTKIFKTEITLTIVS